jgi:broad specificity phosphatase PhoE
MTLTYYFLRHGETEASRSGAYTGDLDVGLTPEGHQMAEDFAGSYGSLLWEAVFSSPLRRCVDTAKPFAEAVGLEVRLRDGLKEISFGAWEGKTPQQLDREFHDDYVSWLADAGWNRPTRGERGIDVARRSLQVIDEIEQTHSSGNVLLVSHKATLRIILCALLGIDVGHYRDRLDMPVASLALVQMTGQGPMLKSLGDRSHLREGLRLRSGT